MREAHREYRRLVAEEKSEKMLKEAFSKEFAEEELRFTKITKEVNFSMYTLLAVFAAFCLIFVLGFGSDKHLDFALWTMVVGEAVLGIGNFVYILDFRKKRDKFFEEFKAKVRSFGPGS